MEHDHAKAIAASAGLTKLGDEHLAQLSQAIASSRELAAKLPKDLHWSEEIALTFRLPLPRDAKP